MTRQMTRHGIKFIKVDLEFSQISYQMSPEVFLYFFLFFYNKNKDQNKSSQTVFNEESYVSFHSFE